MSLANVTLTSPLTYFTPVQSAQPFVLPSSVSPLPPLHLAPVIQRRSARSWHGNRLSRRSLNVGDGRSSQVLVSKGGAKRIAINDNGSVTTTTTPNSIFSALEVILLCKVASDLSLDFPNCLNRETASTRATENQSLLSFVLLFFRHSDRYLCMDRKARVYSLLKVGDYRSKVSECVFQHDIYASNYDTYHSRQYSPGGARNGSEQQSPGGGTRCYGAEADSACYIGRWYLSVKGSKVTTRKTSRAKPLPRDSALFIQMNVEPSSFKDNGQGPFKDFVVSDPTSTQSTPLPVTGSRRGQKGKTGRRKGGRGRTTETPPFSVSPRRRGQRKDERGNCGNNLLGRCVSKKTKPRGEDTKNTDQELTTEVHT